MNDFMSRWRPRILSVLRIVTALLFMQYGTQKMFIGLFTRPTAFILSGLMAFAYFIAHAPQNFWPPLNGGELAATWPFLFLYLAFAGGGQWSVDCLRHRSRAGDSTIATRASVRSPS